MKERFDDTPVNPQTESIESLQNLRGYLLEKHARLTVDIERLDHVIMARHQGEFDFDATANYEHALGQALEAGEITAEEAIEALGRFES